MHDAECSALKNNRVSLDPQVLNLRAETLHHVEYEGMQQDARVFQFSDGYGPAAFRLSTGATGDPTSGACLLRAVQPIEDSREAHASPRRLGRQDQFIRVRSATKRFGGKT